LLSVKAPGSDAFVPADSVSLKLKGISEDGKCACKPKAKPMVRHGGSFFQKSSSEEDLGVESDAQEGPPSEGPLDPDWGPEIVDTLKEAAELKASQMEAAVAVRAYNGKKITSKRPWLEIPDYGSYCAVWGKTRPHGKMPKDKAWCYVDPSCEGATTEGREGKPSEATWAICKGSGGPAYTKEVNSELPTSYEASIEYKCWPGYTLDGSAGGKTKITSTVNWVGRFFPSLPAKCQMIKYTICGWARDARNARGLGGITVEAGGKSVTTWGNGFYRIYGVPAGATTLKMSGGAWITVTKNFDLQQNTHCEGVGSIKLSPKMANDEWRAVLSWGRRPPDLDTHVYWGTRKTLWYRRGMNWGYGLGVRLEKDDVNGYGPETTFFRNVGSCTSGSAIHCDLTYKIKDYGRNRKIRTSDASVILYHGDHVEGEFKIKDAPESAISADKNWWHVFTIDGKTNKLKYSSTPPSFLQVTPKVTPMNGTGYDGLGPFPRRKWKRRSQRDPELAKVRRAMLHTRTTHHKVQQSPKVSQSASKKDVHVSAHHNPVVSQGSVPKVAAHKSDTEAQSDPELVPLFPIQ